MKKIILLILIVQSIACTSNKENAEQAAAPVNGNAVQLTPEQVQRSGIKTGRIEKRKMAARLQVNGIIDVPPQNMISITFPLGGYLKSTKLLPGMHLRKGEELAVMEDPRLIQLQQDYLTAKIKGRQLEQEYNRQQELNVTKTSSDKSFQEAEAVFKSNKVLIRSLSEQLKLAGINPEGLTDDNISRSVAIRSPIDGYVAVVKVNVGAFVNPSDVLFELVDPKDIHLNMTIFEKDIQYVSIGQKVMTWTNSEPGKKFPCEIILIGKELDEHRSVEVHCHFEAYDKNLLPGMFMNAEIQIKEKETDVVPEGAVVSYQDKNYIFQLEAAGKYSMVPVRTGIKDGGYIEILPVDEKATLPENIVTDQAYTLLMQLMNKEEE